MVSKGQFTSSPPFLGKFIYWSQKPQLQEPVAYAEEDLRREEDEIKELEIRKKTLEDRVSEIERDLGGLLGR